MSIILAIDYGEVKSGIAVSDESQVFAFGLTSIQTKDLLHEYGHTMSKQCITTLMIRNVPNRYTQRQFVFIRNF